ncbi:hypothetical protein J2Z62_000358 [Mycoplasmoides fastidiosum]|uniref:Uncharacterized protein n=1 Tax=Mycoplasmoides fastidiosum TaxID=92758 RepID=A0ABU0LYZ2_9BACT|nr:hypothetical protein [Mycoplasmoides fastidiosum]MDQ0513920.1 hypothetical protein [Mycoplasmoides fastidiosum]UUD37666.1 hypothetical protein NPA10_03805 [Mycoplasmoides fastidiosum]
MKLKLRSNPVALWLWLSLLVIAPLLVFYILMGEWNLLHQNWIIAQNQNTPVFYYPTNPANFSGAWNTWIRGLPPQYLDYFRNLMIDPATTSNYVGNNLVIDGVVQEEPVGAKFFYPFATVNPNAFYIFLAFIFIHVVILGIYHLICRIFLKRPLLATDCYVFLFAFWFTALILFYSGAFPGFGGQSSSAWFVVIIRILIMAGTVVIGFYFPFKFFAYLNRNLNDGVYLENLKEFREQVQHNQTDKTWLQKNKEKNYINLKK